MRAIIMDQTHEYSTFTQAYHSYRLPIRSQYAESTLRSTAAAVDSEWERHDYWGRHTEAELEIAGSLASGMESCPSDHPSHSGSPGNQRPRPALTPVPDIWVSKRRFLELFHFYELSRGGPPRHVLSGGRPLTGTAADLRSLGDASTESSSPSSSPPLATPPSWPRRSPVPAFHSESPPSPPLPPDGAPPSTPSVAATLSPPLTETATCAAEEESPLVGAGMALSRAQQIQLDALHGYISGKERQSARHTKTLREVTLAREIIHHGRPSLSPCARCRRRGLACYVHPAKSKRCAGCCPMKGKCE
ncbi:hypothetical protein BX600DRAFT_82358 [Xylariales sp. PMI_506]|nr:hypothetical protein BX600DRAFT_82358 [Xylariales sp. PMI_506]